MNITTFIALLININCIFGQKCFDVKSDIHDDCFFAYLITFCQWHSSFAPSGDIKEKLKRIFKKEVVPYFIALSWSDLVKHEYLSCESQYTEPKKSTGSPKYEVK
jgi:hypothetical protein